MDSPHPPQKERPEAENFALMITRRIGSPLSLVLHTIFFTGMFCLPLLGIGFDKMLLVLTTVVSLEAIYLSIFIQMTVNHQAKQIEEVSEDIDDIQEDVEEISKDMEDIQEDVEEISKDIDGIQEDVEEIQEEHEEDVSETKILAIEQKLEALLQEVRTLKK